MRIFYFLLIMASLGPIWASSSHYHSHDSNHSLGDALKTGVDTNGKPLFLCLANIFNSTQPGKTWPGYGRCNVPYGGKEYIVDRFVIPSRATFNNAYWQDNLQSALVVGRDTNGAPLFLCQAFFQGSKQPGKTWPGYNHCNISYAGREIITDNYRVLANDDPYNRHGNAMERQCISGPFGDRVCGYNCLRSFNQVACADTPDQQCMADNFGHIACGYGCVKSPFKVACADQPWKNCVINTLNEIHCGKDCRIDSFNNIQCG